MDTATEVLKWVLLILLAGFIGQFGKSLSLRIMHYFQNRKKKEVADVAPTAQEADRTMRDVTSAAEHKKKEVADAAPTAQEADRTVGTVSSEAEQKALKKMLKNQTKLDKKREKQKSKSSK